MVTVRGTDDGFVVADDGPGLPADVADSAFGAGYDFSRLGLLFV
jgi:signal transduction histidine kinase